MGEAADTDGGSPGGLPEQAGAGDGVDYGKYLKSSGPSIAALGLSVYGSITGGKAKQASYQAQADRAARAAEFGKLQAEQTDLHFRDELNTTLGNIDVIRAAAHIDPSSPTTAAIDERQRMLSDRQRTSSLLSIKSQISEDEASAAYLRKAGDYAVSQSYLKAGIDVASALGKAASGRFG